MLVLSEYQSSQPRISQTFPIDSNADFRSYWPHFVAFLPKIRALRLKSGAIALKHQRHVSLQ